MSAHRKSPQSDFDPRSVNEHIVETPLHDEMSRSFLEYAYSVIYARALPDARDGLKPVQRRILYQMGQMNLGPDRPYMKSARVVGEVMGKLHPHGDSAIYEAMVRLAQPFAMRIPLVDGHGNFGSLDDGPAASRYTEARLAPAALGRNADRAEETVDFSPNYDNKLVEPIVLPSAIPNLLVNGASGIAVGMATNMATHNLAEVVAAAKHLMRQPNATLEELMRYVPGPDWPGGGIIIGRDGIREAYATGRGTVTTRSATHIENVTARKKAIVVTELPYMVGPERVLERISEGVKNRKLEGISGAIDLTDRHNGTRLVIEIKTGFDPNAVLEQLFRHTPLEENFTINNVALVDGRPHTMGLCELLRVWIDHRHDVVRRRSEFRKRKALERLHLVEGLLLALLDIDEVIEVIRTSDDADAAKGRLMTVFDLDEVQAQYILDLRLRRLTRMSRMELEGERDDLNKQIAELDAILGSPTALNHVIVEEMDRAVEQWGSPRRTLLLDQGPSGDILPVDTPSLPSASAGRAVANSAGQRLSTVSPRSSSGKRGAATLQLSDEPCAVLFSASGRIARSTAQSLASWQARTDELPRVAEDEIVSIFTTTTLATYALVTSAGRLITSPVADLPLLPETVAPSVAGGVVADELLTMTESTEATPDEHVVAAMDISDVNTPLAMATQRGVVKRWNRESPETMDSWSIMDVKDGDAVIFAAPAHDDDQLVFLSSDASLLTFSASLVRPQGRGAAGMAGIRLAESSRCIAFNVVKSTELAWKPGDEHTQPRGAVVLTVAGDGEALAGVDNGSAKLTPLELYPTKGRGTGGVRSQRFLAGQNTLILGWIGQYPLLASSAAGHAVPLPPVDMRRDGSGRPLPAPVSLIAG